MNFIHSLEGKKESIDKSHIHFELLQTERRLKCKCICACQSVRARGHMYTRSVPSLGLNEMHADFGQSKSI